MFSLGLNRPYVALSVQQSMLRKSICVFVKETLLDVRSSVNVPVGALNN